MDTATRDDLMQYAQGLRGTADTPASDDAAALVRGLDFLAFAFGTWKDRPVPDAVLFGAASRTVECVAHALMKGDGKEARSVAGMFMTAASSAGASHRRRAAAALAVVVDAWLDGQSGSATSGGRVAILQDFLGDLIDAPRLLAGTLPAERLTQAICDAAAAEVVDRVVDDLATTGGVPAGAWVDAYCTGVGTAASGLGDAEWAALAGGGFSAAGALVRAVNGRWDAVFPTGTAARPAVWAAFRRAVNALRDGVDGPARAPRSRAATEGVAGP